MKLFSAVLRSVAPAALLVMSLSGCGGDSSDAVSESTKSRNMTPVASQASQDNAVNGIAALGLELLAKNEGNAVVSPYSASLSLARLQAGANGDTATALSALTRFTGAPDQLYPTLNKLSLGIDSRLAEASHAPAISGSFNGAWSQTGYGYKVSYLDLLAEHFGLKPSSVDFVKARGDALQTVDAWSQQRSGLLPDLHVSSTTRFVLGDAVRLSAVWSQSFDPGLTEVGAFKPASSPAIPVEFMRKNGEIPYASGNGYVAIALPLQRNQQFLMVLPDEGRFAEVQASLTPERLREIVAALVPAQVDLAMPKFSIQHEMQISVGVASSIGVADFSALDGGKDLYVSDTFHTSILSVREEGLRAGSATLLALDDAHPETSPGESSYSSVIFQGSTPFFPDTIVILGRPFIFAVTDSATGTILFLGRLTDPQPL